MQRFCTKNFFLVMFSFVAISMMGQTINTLTINSPSGIAGDYLAVRAQFGSQSNTPITGNAAFVNDGTVRPYEGCSAIKNNVTGLIAFVDRGTCQFGAKALEAQKAGAVVCVICQNAANATQDPFPTVVGDFGAQVTIPTFMVSYATCQKIRADIIAGGVNVTLRNTCKNTSAYGPTVVWGKEPKQGDFDGGLNDWIVDKENTWKYVEDGNIKGGAYGGVQMTSFSACNGVMAFNSDFLDNGGVAGDFGAGLCPQPCTGSLISPVIDFTGVPIDGIVVEFHQGLRQFQSKFYLITSKDGGVSWPDTVRFNTEYPVNSNAISAERKRIALVGYKDVKKFRMQFYYLGNYYYWGIDDVVVINESKADVQVNENFYAVAPSLRVPAGQVSEMPFLADVSNVGNGNATNVKLELVVTDPQNANAEVIRLANNYGALPAGAIQENKPFPATWAPPANPGRYNASYIITSTEDPTGANNKRDYFFDVTENTFANLLPEAQVTPANYMTYSLSPWTVGGTVTYYSGGNIYYVKNGKNVTIDKVRFGLANDIANVGDSGFIDVDVYEFDDKNKDHECSPTERKKVGSNSIYLDGSIDNLRLIEIPVFGLDGSGNPDETKEVDLKDNTSYIVMAHTHPIDPSAERYQLLGYAARTYSAFDRSTNYNPTNYAFDTLKINRSAGSLFAITGTSENDVESRNFEIIQNGTLQSTAFLEMDVKTSTRTYDINDKAEVKTFPNPASRELFIDILLDKLSQNVKVDMVAMDGKIATTKTFSGIQDARLRLDLTPVTSGTYSLLIKTDHGVITRKIIVQK